MPYQYLRVTEPTSIVSEDCRLKYANIQTRNSGITWRDKRTVQRRSKPADLTSAVTSQILASYGFMSYPLWASSYYPPGKYPCKQDGRTYNVGGLTRPTWSFPAPHASRTSWEVGLRNKIASEAVSFAESIGEYRETLGALEKCVKSIADYAKSLRDCVRKGKCRKPKRFTKRKVCRMVRDLSYPKRKKTICSYIKEPSPTKKGDPLQSLVDTDLAIKFGLAPNIALLEDALVALDRVKPDRRRLTMTIREDFGYSDGVGLGSGPFAYVQENQVRRVVAWVRWTRPSAWTAGNPAEAWWAAVPLSFVIDWFFNVGAYLTGLNSLTGVEIIGTTSLKVRQSVRLSTAYTGFTVKEEGRGVQMMHSRQTFNTTTLGLGSIKFQPTTSDALGKLFTSLEIAKGMFHK